MPMIDLVFALLVAVGFSLVLVNVFNIRGPGPLSGLPFFIVVLFLSVWAVGIWIIPVGPVLLGRSWLTFVLVGAIFTLFLAAVVRSVPKKRVLDLAPPEEKKTNRIVEQAFGVFFWLLMIVLLGIIVARYFLWVA